MKKSLIFLPLAVLALVGCGEKEGTTGATPTAPGPVIITTGGQSGTPAPAPVTEHSGLTQDDAFTVAEAELVAQALENKTFSATKYYVSGVVTKMDEDNPWTSDYGNFSFYLSDTFLAFRLKNGSNHEKFTSGTAIEVGDRVMLYGQLQHWYEKTEITYSYKSGHEGYVVSVVKAN